MKRAAIYTRVSIADQHPETQPYDLREMAKQGGYEIMREYSDVISGSKANLGVQEGEKAPILGGLGVFVRVDGQSRRQGLMIYRVLFLRFACMADKSKPS